MKTGLLIVSAAVLVLCVVFYLAPRSSRTPAAEPAGNAREASTAAAADQLSTELSAPESRVPAEPTGLAGAPAVESTAPAEMRPENDLAPLKDLSAKESSASVDLLRPAGSDFFADKYSGRDAKERRLAIDRLKAIVDAHEAGTSVEEQTFSETQVQAMRAEIEWLKSNLSP